MNGGEHGEEEIEQDEGIGVPGAVAEQNVDGRIRNEDDAKGDDEGPGAAEAGDGIGNMFTEGGALFNELVWIAAGAGAHQFLRIVELAGLHGEHVHAGHGAAAEQHGEVVAANLKAGGFLHGHGGGLVGRALEQGGESEEVAVFGLVDDDFLLVLVGGDDADLAGHDDVGVLGVVAGLEDALARREFADFDLGAEDRGFVVIEQFEQWDVA